MKSTSYYSKQRWKRSDVVCRKWISTGIVEHFLILEERTDGWYLAHWLEEDEDKDCHLHDYRSVNNSKYDYDCYLLKDEDEI
mgnify:CR=1 FL=1